MCFFNPCVTWHVTFSYLATFVLTKILHSPHPLVEVNCLSTTEIWLLSQTLPPNVADDCGLSSCSGFSCTRLALLTSAFLFTLYWYKVLKCSDNLDQSILVIYNSLHYCSPYFVVPPFYQFLYTTQFPRISGAFFVFYDNNVAFLDRRFFLWIRSDPLLFTAYWWNWRSSVRYSFCHLFLKWSRSDLRYFALLATSVTLLEQDPLAGALFGFLDSNLLPIIKWDGVRGSSISSP